MNRDSKGRFISSGSTKVGKKKFTASGSTKRTKKPEKKIFIEKEKPEPKPADPDVPIASISGDYQGIMHGTVAIVRATGDESTACATGWHSTAEVTGKRSFAISTGVNGRVKGALGSWIACVEYWEDTPVNFKVAKVDGKTIKANTLYTLRCGKFVEVKD